MTENENASQEILGILRRLEGSYFVGGLGPVLVRPVADCSCQNCACDSRSGDTCGCKPDCSCQGYTADQISKILDPMLGVATLLPIEDIQTLMGIREKLGEAAKKRR